MRAMSLGLISGSIDQVTSDHVASSSFSNNLSYHHHDDDISIITCTG